MYYAALACDYDGTIAHDGIVDSATVAALERVRQSGRRLLLVTGRQLGDLQDAFGRVDLFDRVVAENGAVVYDPRTRERQLLGDPPPEAFVAELRRLHVDPLAIGEVIVATVEPQQVIVLDVIRRMGLELHVVFNKGAVMVLPSGLNKASGLRAALASLQLSPHNVVGIGDAENDHAFLGLCEVAVATANAVETLKARADRVTRGARGQGVIELADDIIATDLAWLDSPVARHRIQIGTTPGGDPIAIGTHDRKVLVVGPSGSGKSSLVTRFLEGLLEAKYQWCVIDPEGDYEKFPDVVHIGDAEREPKPAELMALLAVPKMSVVVSLLAVPLGERPAFLASLLPGLLQLRQKTGRPGWIVFDEAHHLLPAGSLPEPPGLAALLQRTLFVTVHPGELWRPVLDDLDLAVATGSTPPDVRAAVPAAAGAGAPAHVGPGEALVWTPGAAAWRVFRPQPPHAERLRHRRKYAAGDLGPDRSFLFTGPAGALNLRAQNLMMFLQMADGVDDETWRHHLRRGDYSKWFREAIKDDDLAREAAAIEASPDEASAASRKALRTAIERRYTRPASIERA